MEIPPIYNELILLANTKLDNIKQSLPQDMITCLGLFVESVRVLDFMMLGQPGVPKSEKISLSIFDLNMIEMGWNLATSMLLKSGNICGFPMIQSTNDLRKRVMSLLYDLGVIVQLKRVAEMLKTGLVIVKKNGSTYTFSQVPEAKDQFLDELEGGALEKLYKKLKSSGTKYKGWELVDQKNIDDALWKVGNYMAVRFESELASHKVLDIDAYMIPLIKQWDSGNHGIMLGYDSTPDIDNHFLAIAAELTSEWRDEAGIHPNTRIGKISAAEVLEVAMIVISFHIKHIHFAQLASEKDKSILIPQSLSIWTPVNDLINDISEFSGINKEIVKAAINSITLKPEDVKFLEKHTSLFRPLLIDIGSGFVFRPVSCVMRNPLHSVYALLEYRDSSLVDRISNAREEWLRHYLYLMFAGTRYQRVEGNIKIRSGGEIITDIDATIYDNLTGELALIQIKWQNYFSNDVKKLTSRAKNFVSEIDKWTEKICIWVNDQEILHIIKSLKLKGATTKLTKSKIYLFGLSKNAARMKGYGFVQNNNRIAIGTWAQFARNRTEIGPAPLVISKLFNNLKEEENATVKCKPMPVIIPYENVTFDFKDLWSTIND